MPEIADQILAYNISRQEIGSHIDPVPTWIRFRAVLIRRDLVRLWSVPSARALRRSGPIRCRRRAESARGSRDVPLRLGIGSLGKLAERASPACARLAHIGSSSCWVQG